MRLSSKFKVKRVREDSDQSEGVRGNVIWIPSWSQGEVSWEEVAASYADCLMNYSNQLLRKWMEFRRAVRPCFGSVPGRDWVYTGFRTVPNSIRRAPMQYRAARYGHNLCIGEFVPAKPS